MRTLMKISALTLFLANTFSIALAQSAVGKGVLVVRRGAANADANYDKDDHDANGNLAGVSVQCSPDVKYPATSVKLKSLIGNQKGFDTKGTANSTCFINAKGNVKTDPQKDNPNHCLINSVPPKVVKGCFQMSN